MLFPASLLALLGTAAAYATTHYGGLNVHDPSCVQNSGKYYCFSTGGLISYWKASSMAGPWAYQGTVFSSAPKVGGTDLWAPDLHQVNGVYYLYYASSTFGSQNSKIGLATSTTLNKGSWTDHGQVIASSANAAFPYDVTNAIDPNLIIDASGKPHLNWGSFWGDIYQVPLNSALTAPSGGAATQISLDPAGTRPEEGSFVNYHGGYYYLWVSHGQCCNFNGGKSLPAAGTEYKIIIGRSTKVNGPFLDQAGKSMTAGGGTTIMASNGNVYAPGGQGVFTDADGSDVLYYHYLDKTVSYDTARLGYNKITYSNGWPTLS
ncbi:glycoside hydrolase family 43 protein [Myriangium duriaei CBS 260.36]|uniref:Arabinan endo-1,5-alpha-L-arabinosidase n=1 Tax=Myriangium duriaei CBS 260.36 TaxID=1168546 RepID=A0A9P4IWF5_9PEZI|nr:glycoside hydrolase family 43 protein [Myriangium duriaei CBS 260.36]